MIFASSGPLGKPLGGHLGRLGGLLDRLGAILGRLGGLLDHLGTILDRLKALLGRLGPVLDLSGAVLGVSWAVWGASGAVLGGGAAITNQTTTLRPSPGTPPFRASPPAKRHSLVPRSFRYLGRHGNGKSASATCPRSLMAPFALGNLGVESLLRHRSLLGALVFRDVYVAARSWEPWCRELLT